MSSSIAQSLIPAPTQEHSFTPEQIAIIKNSVAKGVSNDELDYFLEVCRSTGLNPLHRQIYAIVRSGKMTIQTGIDGYRLLAARSRRHAGTDDAIYDTETAPHPNKATVTVYRLTGGQRCPYTATARWAEYKQDAGQMWSKFPYLMLAKCAEALALRKAFPAETSGIYTDEEMMQADNPLPALAAPVTVTEEHPKEPIVLELKNIPVQHGVPPTPKSSMTANQFFLKVRATFDLNPKQAMELLRVKSVAGVNLEEAYREIEKYVRAGEESQEVPEEVS
jgi:phage recombination protein Bet